MHHRVDQDLLVGVGQLRHVAKVHVGDAAVLEGENVARVRVPVEKAELQQLPQAGAHPHRDEVVHVDARLDDALGVRATDPVDPLHDQQAGPAVLAVHLGDLHRLVSLEVLVERADVARLLQVVQLLQELLPKLVHDELGVAAELPQRPGVDEAAEPAEQEQVAVDDRLDARAQHLDGHVLARGNQAAAVDLPQGGGRDGFLRDLTEDLLQGATQRLLHDVKGRLVGERRHVVLQHAQLVHVVLADDVRAVGQHLPRLDEGWPKVREGLA
mmetsp:Transcript_5496/g.18589  ORF Transcript_5496/g.18589 Transcript_5496/m.18589 type:complete len:270 (+) Transcript_5496:228-1037(+)